MNKPPQPITGPASVPNPAPSPGLTQAAYGPGQPPSLVFATPSQMNSAPQPRQFSAGPRTIHQQGGYRAMQAYYQNRPMATGAQRVQTSSGPRPVGPTHVYPPGSQMMMISQQQLSFAGSPQGYFIPSGQYRPPYMAPTQQYPVTSGTAGFYPGTSPAEYSAYAGAYYPAQSQYTASVQPAPVLISPAQQQQQALPPQQPPVQPPGPPKRERKPIRIRDPNQGGRDITEEIMSGGRSLSTPTPPQAFIADGSPVQINGEITQPVATVTRTEEITESPANTETPPLETIPEPEIEVRQEIDSQTVPTAELSTVPVPSTLVAEVPLPLVKDQQSIASLHSAATSTPVTTDICEDGDAVDARVGSSPSLAAQEVLVKKVEPQIAAADKTNNNNENLVEGTEEEKEEPVAISESVPEVEVPAPSLPDGTLEEMSSQSVTAVPDVSPETAVQAPTCVQEHVSSVAQSPLCLVPEPQPAESETVEPLLLNGFPQDSEELSEDMVLSDATVLEKDDASQSQESTPGAATATSGAATATPGAATATPAQEKEVEEEVKEKSDDSPPVTVICPIEETTMQPAISVPKKSNLKEPNEKETNGDILDSVNEEQAGKAASEPSTQADVVPVAQTEVSADSTDAADEIKEENEDKGSAESEPTPDSTEQKEEDKEELLKQINADDKKRYNRDFLLGFQFIDVSLHKPVGLPPISDVVLDKANKTPLRPPDATRLMSTGPDFTPSFLGNLGSRSMGAPRGMPLGPRRSQQGQRKEPRKIIINSMSLGDDVQLSKTDNAWKPSVKKSGRKADEAAAAGEEDDTEQGKTQELFKQLRSILNKLTPQKFQELVKQVTDLKIDTEERLKGTIDLIFEKAISEPKFSVAYANMCRCLITLKVPTSDKPGGFVNFRKLLLNRCQKEFEKDQDDDELFEEKQKELDASKNEEERERLKTELDEARDKARARSLGNVKFIGELFKLKILTEPIMHDCVMKLLKNHDEESLECLCRLLSTIGKDLDFPKAKPRMDQYFHQMDKIIKDRKTSSRIRFMLQDALDLRRSNWVPRRMDQGPKTIDQIHKDAELEEHREQIKVQQQLLSKKDMGGGGGRMSGGMGGRGSTSSGGGRTSQPQDEGWNTVPISKNRPIDTTRLSKITKSGALDFNNQLLAPGGKGMWGSWGKGSSGGSGAKASSGEQDPGRPATSTLNRFSALQQSGSMSSSTDSDRRVPQRSSSSRERGGERDRNDRDKERFDHFDRSEGREGRDDRSSRHPNSKRSFSRESQERTTYRGDSRPSVEPVRRVASMTYDRDRGSRDRGSKDRGSQDRGSKDRGSRDRRSKDRGSRDRRSKDRGSRDRRNKDLDSRERGSKDRSSSDRGSGDRGSGDRGSGDRAPNKDLTAKREAAPTPPPSLSQPALSEEEVDKKSAAIIEEYLHINDMKEALLCVSELNSMSLLYVFVRTGVEATLERSTITRERIGLLFHQLVKAGTLPMEQYCKGLQEILEAAEDMAIDIPHIWLYLAEIITPVLHEDGVPMGQLFREISKPLVPLEKAGVLLAQILTLLCKGMTPKKVGAMWTEAELNWRDYLPEDVDVNKFVTEKKVEYTLGEEMESGEKGKKILSGEEMSKQLDRLLQDKANNKRITDWVEANLDEQQVVSNQFVRALMTAVCQTAIICDNPYRVDASQIAQRAELLQLYLSDEQKELQALYALQALMVHLEQPANLLRMFFDALYDEDVIKEEAFYKWESSKDPAEQTGKGVALKSVTAFFTWLREAEEESDKD